MEFIDSDFGVCKILHQKGVLGSNVCLFAGYSFLPKIPEYVYYYLESIREADFSIVFISSSPIDRSEIEKLSLVTNIIIEKENLGTDFGAWCSILRWLNFGRDFSHLYLCNDSVFGPFMPFKDIHARFYLREEQVLGLTNSYQGANHIQSYFVGIKKTVLLSDEWGHFWRSMQLHKEKRKVIDFYEVGLTQMILDAGFKCFIWTEWSEKIKYNNVLQKVSSSKTLQEAWINRVLYEKEEIIQDINPSSFLWNELITDCNHPFIKRELFLFANLFEECEIADNWERILKNKDFYPSFIIKKYLIQHFFLKQLRTDRKAGSTFTINCLKRTTVYECITFKSLGELLPEVEYDSKELARINTKFTELEISFLPIQLKHTTSRNILSFIIYLDEKIVNFEMERISELVLLVKENPYLVILTPDYPRKVIVTSLLMLTPEAVISEDELYNPTSSKKLYERLNSFWNFSYSDASLQNYQRPSLQEIVLEAINGTDNSSFLSASGALQISDSNIFIAGSSLPDHLENTHDEYLKVKEKYAMLYEKTPYWYKFLGQIIKLFTGHKRISLIVKDKNLKDHYSSTAADMAHWYYVQYEVLPKWYKKIGNNLAFKRTKL